MYCVYVKTNDGYGDDDYGDDYGDDKRRTTRKTTPSGRTKQMCSS